MPLLFLVTLALLVAAGLVGLTGRYGLAKILGMAGLTANGSCLAVMVITAARPPLFGPFEVTMLLSFVATLAGLVSDHKLDKSARPVAPLAGLAAAGLLLLCWCLAPLRMNDDFYLYDYIWTVLFFFLRSFSMAIFFTAVIFFAAALTPNRQDSDADRLLHRGRLVTLTGATVFLIGEFSGSMWSYYGWGETWLWNKDFFTAASFFLLALLGGHLPRRWAGSRRHRALLNALPLVAIVLVFLLTNYEFTPSGS